MVDTEVSGTGLMPHHEHLYHPGTSWGARARGAASKPRRSSTPSCGHQICNSGEATATHRVARCVPKAWTLRPRSAWNSFPPGAASVLVLPAPPPRASNACRRLRENWPGSLPAKCSPVDSGDSHTPPTLEPRGGGRHGAWRASSQHWLGHFHHLERQEVGRVAHPWVCRFKAWMDTGRWQRGLRTVLLGSCMTLSKCLSFLLSEGEVN